MLLSEMKSCGPVLLLIFFLVSCAGQQSKVIFRPEDRQDQTQEWTDPLESWQIIETQNGSGYIGIPEWVRRYYDRDISGIESSEPYTGKYVFIGENRGDNFNALQRWANGFTAAQDMPGLVALRVEQRLVTSASLYPDDEYGEFFATVIRNIFDGEYQGAVKEQTFWIKRKVIVVNEELDMEDEVPGTETIVERYEFLVLLSIDSEILRRQIRDIMTAARTSSTATREQAAAINRVQQTFFEGF